MGLHMSLQERLEPGGQVCQQAPRSSVPVQNAEYCTVPVIRGFLLGKLLSLTTSQAAVPVQGRQPCCCSRQQMRLLLCRGGGHGQGGPSNPDAYVQPNMLEDPWADLMRDFHRRHIERQQQQPASSSAGPAAAGAASMADVLAAADQVATSSRTLHCGMTCRSH